MFLKIVLLSALSFSVAQAKEVQIQMNQLKYNISFSSELIRYTGSLVDLSLKKEACNEHIVSKFNLLMNKMLKEEFEIKHSSDSYMIIIDGKKFFESQKTIRANFFKDFDKVFKQAKTEEFANCTK